jgi:1-deoxy-D-xylulose-5-phosphate synthase
MEKKEPEGGFPLLDTIEEPEQLRAMRDADLPALADELRDFLIGSVAESGGHFAAGLGVVELTVALHAVFDTPADRLVWDTGHQAYPHKILTGRRRAITTVRKKGGLSGFPRRSESPYDTFGVAHAGTSLSAAAGMAEAVAQTGEDRKVVAIIGDGAISAGMAYEALNHAGKMGTDLTVILNDNEMSISPSVGAMCNYLTRLRTSSRFRSLRDAGRQILTPFPPARELLSSVGEHAKGMVTPSTLFEELGFEYYGPVDGHDVPGLVQALRNLRSMQGPRLLHINTVKGKGYQEAERDPVKYHGVSAFNPAEGLPPGKPGRPSYNQVFGQWLCDMAEQDPDLMGLTPAMREGSDLVEFEQRFPDRYFDTAIAEQHTVTLAAGMACEGRKPVVAIYSTFLQRAYDQLIHDVALQDLDVTFALDRAGVVGPDGATHAGVFDFSFLRCVPNMVVMAPADENECRQMLYTAYRHTGPASVRYPRGKGPGTTIDPVMTALPLGKGEIRRRGKGIALLGFGTLLDVAMEVGDRIGATVVNMRFIKPVDADLLEELLTDHDLLVTLEDNVASGGAGTAVREALDERGRFPQMLRLGLPDRFLEHGSREEILAECGLDAEGVLESLRPHLQRREQACTAAGAMAAPQR